MCYGTNTFGPLDDGLIIHQIAPNSTEILFVIFIFGWLRLFLRFLARFSYFITPGRHLLVAIFYVPVGFIWTLFLFWLYFTDISLCF